HSAFERGRIFARDIDELDSHVDIEREVARAVDAARTTGAQRFAYFNTRQTESWGQVHGRVAGYLLLYLRTCTLPHHALISACDHEPSLQGWREALHHRSSHDLVTVVEPLGDAERLLAVQVDGRSDHAIRGSVLVADWLTGALLHVFPKDRANRLPT